MKPVATAITNRDIILKDGVLPAGTHAIVSPDGQTNDGCTIVIHDDLKVRVLWSWIESVMEHTSPVACRLAPDLSEKEAADAGRRPAAR